MPSVAELQARPLERGEKVRLVEDIPGHPAGSSGKVAIANGITWLRYWVRFSDGTSVGHIDHSALVRTKDYDSYCRLRELEAAAEHKAAHTDSSDSGRGASGGPAPIGGVATPQRPPGRAKAAKERPDA